jgi:hypothetical protein
MLKDTFRGDHGHVLLDALVSIALVTISIAAALSGFYTSITLLSVHGPSAALLCSKVRCNPSTSQENARIIRCTCLSKKSDQSWEVIR